MIVVSPTILVPSASEFQKRVRSIEPFFSRAQIDVLDNTLVPRTSFADPVFVESLHTHLTFEVDLMVSLNNYNLSQWNRPWVDMIAVHVEASSDPRPYLKTIRSWGKQAFLSLNPETPLSALEPHLSYADGVLFLTVEPGASGGGFQESVIEKIQKFRAENADTEIEADGAVRPATIPLLLAAGVTRVAVGSFLANGSMESSSLELLSAIERAESQRT